MLQRARKGKQEQQRRAFAPRADACAADGDGQHEKMNVNGPFPEPLPDFMRGEPAAGEIGERVTVDRGGLAFQKKTGHGFTPIFTDPKHHKESVLIRVNPWP